jgi:CDP-glycerol glycerophosphotransferase
MVGVRHPCRFLWRGLIQPLLGWLALGWMPLLVPHRRGRVAVFGLSGQFADNAKYFFLQLTADRPPGVDVRYVSDDKALTGELETAGLPVVPYPTLRGLWYLLRAETVVVDASSWVRPMRYQVLWRARKVQLFHGCPLKRIELDDTRDVAAGASGLVHLSQRLIGRYPRYDIVLSPSPTFTDVSFRRAFAPAAIIEDDYPRNAVFSREDPLFAIGTDHRVSAWVADGRRRSLKTVVYMPTFRDDGREAVAEGALDLARLERFAMAHGYQFVFKVHPVAAARMRLDGHSRIIVHDARADVYPLLAQCDVLVTDYSSVFFDFLRTGRPLVFFAWDLEAYQANDRALYFPYEDLVPGPICRDQVTLEAALAEAAGPGLPAHADDRARVGSWAFARSDGDGARRLVGRLWPRVPGRVPGDPTSRRTEAWE